MNQAVRKREENAKQVEAFSEPKKKKCEVSRSIFSKGKAKNFRWLSCGVPPVLIPNTEVKPTYTDSTVLETAWEDRQLPDPKRKSDSMSRSFALPKYAENAEQAEAFF